MELYSGDNKLVPKEADLEFDSKMNKLANCFVICGPATFRDKVCFGPFHDEADAWLFKIELLKTMKSPAEYHVVRVIMTDQNGCAIIDGG